MKLMKTLLAAYAIYASSLVMAMATVPPPTYHNPILTSEDLADPHMIRYNGKYYLYGTYLDGSIAGGSDHYDVFVSDDMNNWNKVSNIFVKGGTQLWAPDVFHDPVDGHFYLYYSNDMSIGVAISPTPTGPFSDLGIIIEEAIDAHMFYDNGDYYMYYSSIEIESEFDMVFQWLGGLLDGSGHKAAENILVQKMSSPTELIGSPVLLTEPDTAWEQGLVLDVNEGAWMYKANDTYYLMYSGHEAYGGDYAIGYATSNSPMGPFTKYDGNPIAKTRFSDGWEKGVFSPGHHSVVRDENGTDWLIYHQKVNYTDFGFSNRYTCADELKMNELGQLYVHTTGLKDF